MPESTHCEICGTEVDTRGLSGHMETHEPEELANVVAEDSRVQTPQDAESALSEATVDENSVTVRATREVVIQDEQLKREVVDELKKMVGSAEFQR